MFRINAKTLVLGGLAVAAVAGALKNRDRVAGLIGARSSEPEPARPESSGATVAAPSRSFEPTRTAPSNYDLSGPAENTATHMPAPEPVVRGDGGIDEKAEEEAAAAEAAAIGGPTPAYAGRSLDEPADEADRPLEEAGEGESEGQEQAEADLVDNAEPSAGDRIAAEDRIEELIDQTEEAGEQVEPRKRPASERIEADKAEQPTVEFAGGKTGDEPEDKAERPRTWSDIGRRPPARGTEPKSEGNPVAGKRDDEGGSEWQTWSGKALR